MFACVHAAGLAVGFFHILFVFSLGALRQQSKPMGHKLAPSSKQNHSRSLKLLNEFLERDLNSIDAKEICNIDLLRRFATYITNVEVKSDFGRYKSGSALQVLSGAKVLIEQLHGPGCWKTHDLAGCQKLESVSTKRGANMDWYAVLRQLMSAQINRECFDRGRYLNMHLTLSLLLLPHPSSWLVCFSLYVVLGYRVSSGASNRRAYSAKGAERGTRVLKEVQLLLAQSGGKHFILCLSCCRFIHAQVVLSFFLLCCNLQLSLESCPVEP